VISAGHQLGAVVQYGQSDAERVSLSEDVGVIVG